ncbi:TIGR04351 family putative TOMM peptide [Sphaerisporangium sp. NPDC005288]|uniref:TIGR04351 family putative TOMM peptide n=1 Tax=Sphaerisporangium rhizosphaerae TaxID=2269375 RepID=A0ABW2PBE4_9ACTN
MAESIYILGDQDRRKFARLIAAAWGDGELRDRYETEPRAVLHQYGIVYPEGVRTPPLPPKPDGEFDITDLETAAGDAASSIGTVSSISSWNGCLPCGYLCDSGVTT